MKRHALANWKGTGKEGNGNLTSQSGVLNATQYSFNTRFADGIGTNPEELIAAAHAGCFSMKLSFNLSAQVYSRKHDLITITLDNGAITNAHLELTAIVPGISVEKFNELVENAQKECPISKLLNTEITLTSTLV